MSKESDTFTIETIQKRYISNLVNRIENPLKSPYDLDRKSFVENIDFEFQIFGNDVKVESSSKNEYLINTLKTFLFSHKLPVVVLGNYGMGKSTIAKYLTLMAIERKILPLHIELRNIKLGSINTDMKQEFINSVVDIAFKYYDMDSAARELVVELFKKKEILIVLDGIDEAIVENNLILSNFLEFIITSKLPIYLSSRLEYVSFVSLYNSKVGQGNSTYSDHLKITLKDWGQTQWYSYEQKLLSKPELTNSYKSIRSFFSEIYMEKFGDIPRRPLFLKMLTKLKIEKDTLSQNGQVHYSLNKVLEGNRSEIYYKYIRWQLFNDLFKHESNTYIDRDGSLNTKTERIIDSFIVLLSYVAVYEYRMNLENKKSSIHIDEIVTLVQKNQLDSKLLTKEFVEDALDETSLFAILQRDEKGASFTFSHKSFMEYLVAYRLADSIFSDDPKCEDVWGYYQTHEVSQHFMFEVQRVSVSKWLKENPNDKKLKLDKLESKIKEHRNSFLVKAFTDVLVYSLYEKKIDTHFYHQLDFDSEKFEEALFYIGRFKLTNNEEVLSILQDIFDDMKSGEDNYHPVYYRTVSLALAQMKSIEYCNEYVEFLLEDYKTISQKHFKTNLEIQRDYYGEDNVMLKKLSNYINQFLEAESIQRNIIANDILTYFVLHKSNENNYQARSEYMKEIIYKIKVLNETGLQKICQNIQKLFVEI